jgi:glycosyltransferase A (GT-A) superfamily protein (DUF2064 family)
MQEVSKDSSEKMLTPTKNNGVNTLIFNQLNNLIGRTAAAVSSSTSLPIFYSNQLLSASNKNTFGKQLSEAIQLIFNNGFEKVICVGNDCPSLNKTQISEAAQKLNYSDTVLGPDKRGGVYLLGVSKDTFDSIQFENLAWQSSKMLESYTQQFAQQNIALLESLPDIHTFEDLQTYTSTRYFISFLLQIIQDIYKKTVHQYLYLSYNKTITIKSLRAPPCF